jgi:very-short-patch-repair endonuclease
MLRYSAKLKGPARELRKNLTDSEGLLWKHLRLRQIGGYKFRRQHPIGNYIVDFVCLEKRLIVEVDGSQHTEQSSYDSERDAWLNSQGYRVLRFWNNQIFNELDAVKERISKKINE